MIDWTLATKNDVVKIACIIKRALNFDSYLDQASLSMDLEACHTHGCRLDLDGLLIAADGDLMHDVYGIRRHIDRDTGELCDCFCPRLAERSCMA